jgi:hypothetical protein
VTRYRKKPVEIDAWPVASLLDYMEHDWLALPHPVADAYEAGVLVTPTRDGLTIKTLEGDMFAARTDVLIRGVKGEFYPCKPDIFAATYDEAES